MVSVQRFENGQWDPVRLPSSPLSKGLAHLPRCWPGLRRLPPLPHRRPHGCPLLGAARAGGGGEGRPGRLRPVTPAPKLAESDGEQSGESRESAALARSEGRSLADLAAVPFPPSRLRVVVGALDLTSPNPCVQIPLPFSGLECKGISVVGWRDLILGVSSYELHPTWPSLCIPANATGDLALLRLAEPVPLPAYAQGLSSVFSGLI